MITEQSTLEDICFAVCTQLEMHTIAAVLCGGSAAAIYAPQRYMSYDADFVLDHDDALDSVEEALRSLGFRREGRSRIFSHTRTTFTLDFPKGPLGVGGDYVRSVGVLEKDGLHLRILTRTDCIRDRLAHFYYWDDYEALNAAVAVAANGIEDVDREAIRAWTEREGLGLLNKLAEFERRLSSAIRAH